MADDEPDFMGFGEESPNPKDGPLFDPAFFLPVTSTEIGRESLISAAPSFHDCVRLAGHWTREDEVRVDWYGRPAFGRTSAASGPLVASNVSSGLKPYLSIVDEVHLFRDFVLSPEQEAIVDRYFPSEPELSTVKVHSIFPGPEVFYKLDPAQLERRIQLRDAIDTGNDREPPEVEAGDPLRYRAEDLLTEKALERIERIESDFLFGSSRPTFHMDYPIVEDEDRRPDAPLTTDAQGLHIKLDPTLTVRPGDRVHIRIHGDTADVEVERMQPWDEP